MNTKPNHLKVAATNFDGEIPLWHHFDCFFKRWKGELSFDTVFQGHENLRWDDNQKLRDKLKAVWY